MNKYNLRDSFYNYCFHMASGVMAIMGVVFAFNEVTWLAIIGGVAAFVLRWNGSIRNRKDWHYVSWFDPGMEINFHSKKRALFLTAIGVAPSFFLLNMDLVTSIFFSLNCAILLIYAWALCVTICLHIKDQLHTIKIKREIKKEEIE